MADLELLRSLDHLVNDSLLKSFIKSNRQAFDLSVAEMKKLSVVDRDWFYRHLLRPSTGSSVSLFSKYMLFLVTQFGPNTIPSFVPHFKYDLENGRSVTPREILDAAKNDHGDRRLVDLLSEHRGGEFCRELNEMTNEKVLGSGAFGSVFKLNGEVYKMFHEQLMPHHNGTFGEETREIFMTALISVFAEEENNPHFAKLIEVNSCHREGTMRWPMVFMHLEEVEGTMEKFKEMTEEERSSLLFQSLMACMTLRDHGISHRDIYFNNLCYADTDYDIIDYDHGWSVPTHGKFIKLIDFGKAKWTDIDIGLNLSSDALCMISMWHQMFPNDSKVSAVVKATERIMNADMDKLCPRTLRLTETTAPENLLEQVLNEAFPEYVR